MIAYKQKEHYNMDDFREIVAILRHPGGCPWDMAQDHHSIRRELLEETCELAEAIDKEDLTLLREELGDVLMQVLMHASMEEDAGHFDLDDVADTACKKLIFRHPHVFGTVQVADVEEELANWDQLKRQEKGQKTYTDTLEAVARTLPALWRAEKLQKKAAKAGFAWADVYAAEGKVQEEAAELDEAIQSGDPAAIEEELGDLLFASASLALYAKLDPEAVLHKTCEKFIRRFRATEEALSGDMKEHTVEEMIAAWQRAKEAEHE